VGEGKGTLVEWVIWGEGEAGQKGSWSTGCCWLDPGKVALLPNEWFCWWMTGASSQPGISPMLSGVSCQEGRCEALHGEPGEDAGRELGE
jgi:hypothetical protein